MNCSTTSNRSRQAVGGSLVGAAFAPLAEQFLKPEVLVLEHGEHQVVFALEVLVERGLADADVGQHLVEADVAKAVAVEPRDGGFDEAVARGGHVCGRPGVAEPPVAASGQNLPAGGG